MLSADAAGPGADVPERPRRSRGGVVVIALLGLAGVAQSLLAQPATYREPFFDERRYELYATNLIERGFYGDEAGKWPATAEFRSVDYLAYVPPGYVFFFAGLRAVFGDGDASWRVAQAILAGIAIFAAGFIGLRVFGSVAGIAAAALLVSGGVLANYSQFALSEVMAATTLVVSVAVAVVAHERRSLRLMALAGVVLGLSVLVRPQVLLVPPLIGAWVFLAWGRSKAGAAAGLAFVVGAVLVVTPWTVRNYAKLHALVPVSTYTWINFWLVNHPGSDGLFHRPERDIGVPAVRAIRSRPELEQDRTWRRMALRWVRENPDDAMRGWIRNGRRYVTDPDPLMARWYALRRARVPRFDDRWLFPMALVGALAFTVPSKSRTNSALPLIVALYFLLFFCFFLPTPRFRVGLLPVLAVLSGAGVQAALLAATRGWRWARVKTA